MRKRPATRTASRRRRQRRDPVRLRRARLTRRAAGQPHSLRQAGPATS